MGVPSGQTELLCYSNQIIVRPDTFRPTTMIKLMLFALLISSVLTEEDKLGEECFTCRCPKNVDYQCGTDGRSYVNQCLFKCAQERCPSQTEGVRIARSGNCNQ